MRVLRPMLLACCVAVPVCSSAQENLGLAVRGVVVDAQGGGIAGAQVRLVPRAGGGGVFETRADASGRFVFAGLRAGGYRLRVAAKGFEALTAVDVAADVVADAAGSEPVYTLKVAGVQESVDVVTATRSVRPVAEVPASVSVVSAGEVEQTPARTIDDVLRRVPSVDLPFAGTNEQHPTDTIVSMRGLSGIRSLVLLDGEPLNDAFFGFIQWSEVPLETVERVEVVRGGGATLWGNYAMGGVINILTRPPDRTELVAEAAGGSRGTYRADGHAAVAGDRYGLGLDAGTSHSDGYVEQVAAARGAITVPSGYTADTVALSGDADVARGVSVRGRVSHYSNAQNFLTHRNTNGEGSWRYAGSVHWQADSRDTVTASLFRTSERFTTNNTGTPDGQDTNAAEYVQNIHRTRVSDLGASVLWQRSFAGALRSLAAGGDYHGIEGGDAARISDESAAYVRTDTGSGRQRFAGGFVQAEMRPLERLEVLASVRYQDFLSSNGVDDTPGGLGATVPERRDGAVDPRISARYGLPAGFALRGAVYRAFRAPTLDNLYRAASVPGYILYGNAALEPETLTGGEGGVDYVHGSLRLQATVYDSHIAKLLTYRYLDAGSLPPGFAVGARLINAGAATSRGVEAELEWRAGSRLRAVLGYTHADSVVTANAEDPASVGVQQPGIPKNRGTAGATWTGPGGLQVSPYLRYVSRTNGDPDALFRTDPHFVADLGVSVPVRKGVTAFVQMENLLDRRYVGTNDGFTAPLYGRPFTAVAGLRVKLR